MVIKSKEQSVDSTKTLGTLSGVFTPNILTILGVIMYLRLGWVVGNAGLINTVLILLVAQSITFLTGLSLSSICTNMKIKAGGAYYIISRSLGIEVGGAIGLPLYLSQTFGIGMYIVGFAETLTLFVPGINLSYVGLAALAVLSLMAIISSKLVEKTQYIIMGIIVLSLISFFLGAKPDISNIVLYPEYIRGNGFWFLFAVFFPAVTGMEAGLSMSGDLKDPAKSLPQGTLLAIATGFTTYLIMIFWFALSASRADLMGADIVAVKMAKFPFMVIAGIWAATLSSALASIMAAPRTLQAMARDGVVFRFLAGKREDSGPFVSMLVTIAIASFIVFLGNLNMIAPILTNFFLITYGSINLIAGLERFFSLPSYRPTFHVHWFFSLLGFAGCIIVMFILNPVACIVGFLLVFLIYVYLKRKHFVATFGDARHGFWYGVIHYALNKLESLPFSPKNWRPNLLMFSNDTKVNQNIIQIATSLSGRTGTVTLINFLNPEKVEVTEAKRIEAEISEAFHQAKVPAYFLTALSDDGVEAQLVTSQVYGMGRFRPNTILLNWNESKKKWFGVDKSEKKKQMKLMSFYNEIGKSLLLLHVDDSKGFGNKKHIDVWWDPSHDNGSFMLLIAYLLTLSEEWEDAMIHIKTVVVKKKVTSTGKILKQLLENARIEATINVYHPDSRDEEASVSTVVTSTNLELFVSKVGRSFNLIKDKINLYSFTRTIQDGGVDKLKDEKVISTEKSQGVILKETLEKQMTEEEIDFIEDCVSSIIARESSGVDLVILGFNPPAHGREREYVDKMDNILANLPSVLLVHSSFDMDIYG